MSDVVQTAQSALAQIPLLLKQLEADLADRNSKMEALTAEAQALDSERQEIIAAIGRLTGKTTSVERAPVGVVTRGRRGRKPGSKNKPRVQQPSNGPLATGYTIEPVVDDWDNTRPAAE